MGITNKVKIGDYVSYKLTGYYPNRRGTVTALHDLISDTGERAKVSWYDSSMPLGMVWEWCDHLKVLATTTETK